MEHWKKYHLPKLKADHMGNAIVGHDSAPSSVVATKSNGVALISDERQRQVEKEGWDANHDSEHDEGQLIGAAICYAASAIGIPVQMKLAKPQKPCGCRSVGECHHNIFTEAEWRDPWPWEKEWDKREKHDDLRKLQIAGALIAAEIDRRQGSVVAEQPSREQAVEGLVEQCADEIVQTLLPSMDAERGVRVMAEKSVAPLGAREWWDGQKKYVWPGSRETLFAILDAYADHCTAPLRSERDEAIKQRSIHHRGQLEERDKRIAAERKLKELREAARAYIDFVPVCTKPFNPMTDRELQIKAEALLAALRGKEGHKEE